MHPFHPESVQLDPFGPADHDRPPDTPRWRSLPPPTRRRATVLIARMLLQHRGDRPAQAEAGAGRRRRDGESGDV